MGSRLRTRRGCAAPRRVAWDAPLGYQRARVSFASLHGGVPNGGPLPCTLLLVQRCFPVVYRVAFGGSVLFMTASALAAAESRYAAAAARVSRRVPWHPTPPPPMTIGMILHHASGRLLGAPGAQGGPTCPSPAVSRPWVGHGRGWKISAADDDNVADIASRMRTPPLLASPTMRPGAGAIRGVHRPISRPFLVRTQRWG